MQNEFWHQKWESNQIGFNQQQPNELLIQYFGTLNLKASDRVFVPLCGKSIDMLWLASQGKDVIGVELSSIACDAFFSENNIRVKKTHLENFIVYQGERITILCGDFFDLTHDLLGKVDAVFDRAALIALPPELQRRYATFITRLLEPKTPMLLIVCTYNPNEMTGPPFSIDEDEIRALYGEHFNIKQLCNIPAVTIPEHLKIKGLTQASHQVYYLTFE